MAASTSAAASRSPRRIRQLDALNIGIGGFGAKGGAGPHRERAPSVVDDRFAVGAQSLGGGGSGINISGGINNDGQVIGRHRRLAARRAGGAVTATVITDVLAAGDGAIGVMAQSIGGGGGSGINISGGLQATKRLEAVWSSARRRRGRWQRRRRGSCRRAR
jgi:hypothetical protein